MIKKAIKILSGTILSLGLFSIPSYADVINTNQYKNEVQQTFEYYLEASKYCDTNKIKISKEKSDNLLNRIMSDIKNNTIDEFKNQCITIESVTNKYKNFIKEDLERKYRLGYGGSGTGRDIIIKQTEAEIETCRLLLDEIDKYNNSFDWYIKRCDPEHKHWKLEYGKWYYYQNNGEKAVNTTIDGYVLGADGVRIDH